MRSLLPGELLSASPHLSLRSHLSTLSSDLPGLVWGLGPKTQTLEFGMALSLPRI